MKRTTGLLVLLILIVLSSCARTPEATIVPLPSPTPVGPIDTPLPGPTPTLAGPADTPFPAPTPTLIQPTPTEVPAQQATSTSIGATVPGTLVNLRSGPSELHDIVEKLPRGTKLQLTAQAPGGQWVQVAAPDGKSGWILTELLTLDGPASSLPISDSTNSQWISGKVVDSGGNPIDDVKIRVYQDYEGKKYEASTTSAADGAFNFFLPPDWSGVFSVEITGVGCKSRIIEKNCQYPGTFKNFGRTWVQVPSSETVVFEYQAPTQ